MPDIDMDFDSRYRDEMIRYAAERYGRDHVAQIITFGTIKARNAVRDAARVLGYSYAVGDKIAKAMPPLVMGRDTPLKYCFEKVDKYADGYKSASELRAMYDTDPDVKKVVDVAKGLEGLKRSDGIHAAAVVITKEPLTTYLPMQRKPESGQNPDDAPIVTQYEMGGVEALGLLKIDFLGLRNLDVITDTVAMIRARRDPEFDIDTISLDDADTYALLSRGDTIGVFQLESPPMRQLLKAMAPTTFDHVGALIALYRPGPMGANMHYDYADRKNGRKPVALFHEDAAELLADTYGLMIYQESMMRVAQKFAGYSLAEADNLRKACGKKVREMMARERDSFEAGCERTGYGSKLGKTLFDIIERFADYAFNKSHSYGYGLITYQTAFLKAHYPVEYFACMLSSVKSNLDRAAVYLSDARAMGISVLTPDINQSVTDFAALLPDDVPASVNLPVGSPGAITFGLSAVRNVGEGLVEQLLVERGENGPYSDFHEFAERAPEGVLNKRTVESLIKAGAFDGMGHPRRGLLAVFEQVIDTTVIRRRERDQGVMSLFGDWSGADADDGCPGHRVRRAPGRPRRRVRQGRSPPQREGDVGPLRLGPPVVRGRGGVAAQGRAVDRRSPRPRGRRAGARRGRDHQSRPQVHQEGRPDGGVRARGPRVVDRGHRLPAHAGRTGSQARRRRDRHRQGPPRPARRFAVRADRPDDHGADAHPGPGPSVAPEAAVDVARRAQDPPPQANPAATTPAIRWCRSTSVRARSCDYPTSSVSTSTARWASCAWRSATRRSSSSASSPRTSGSIDLNWMVPSGLTCPCGSNGWQNRGRTHEERTR